MDMSAGHLLRQADPDRVQLPRGSDEEEEGELFTWLRLGSVWGRALCRLYWQQIRPGCVCFIWLAGLSVQI